MTPRGNYVKKLTMSPETKLSRRERQIMDIIYARGQATVNGVVQDMPDAPNRVTVRTLMRILEEKGHLQHHQEGAQYIYTPTRPRQRAGQSALSHVLNTFFDGSLEKAVASHLFNPNSEVPPQELKRVAALIRQARKK